MEEAEALVEVSEIPDITVLISVHDLT